VIAALVPQRASDVVEAALDYKTGNAKLGGVREMESLIKAPYIRLAQGGDVVAATEARLGKMPVHGSDGRNAPAKPSISEHQLHQYSQANRLRRKRHWYRQAPVPPSPGRFARAAAWTAEMAPKALRVAGQIMTVVGAAKEAQRTVEFERAHNRGELNAGLMGAATFVVGVLAGAADDAFAAAQLPMMGAPVLTMESGNIRALARFKMPLVRR